MDGMNLKKLKEINNPYLNDKYFEFIDAYVTIIDGYNKMAKLSLSSFTIDSEKIRNTLLGEDEYSIGFVEIAKLITDKLLDFSMIQESIFKAMYIRSEDVQNTSREDLIFEYQYAFRKYDTDEKGKLNMEADKIINNSDISLKDIESVMEFLKEKLGD